MKCFYHNDLDGQAAAFCVYMWAGITGPHEQNNMLHPITYGDEFPFEIIQKDEQVWIVDYSIEPEEMLKLLETTKNVTWIDHHKTAIEKYKDFPHDIRGVRVDGIAGCVLTYKYLHWWSSRGKGKIDLTINREEDFPVPRMIQLVGDRDVWDWKYGKETKYFFLGSQAKDTSPNSDFWLQCIEHEMTELPPPNTGNKEAMIRGKIFWEQLLNDGKLLDSYIAKEEEKANAVGFEGNLFGYNCWIVNRTYLASDYLEDYLSKYDAVVAFSYIEDKWVISLRSNKIDVSKIASNNGGGGHKGAAGFTCKTLPKEVSMLINRG